MEGGCVSARVLRIVVVFLAVVCCALPSTTAIQVELRLPDVTPKEADTYFCKSLKTDKEKEFYLTSFIPMVERDVAHHMLLVGCEEPGSDLDYWPCLTDKKVTRKEKQYPLCKRGKGKGFIYLWGNNAPKKDLPEGVGIEVGGQSGIHYLVLQVHYADVERFKDNSTDATGFRIDFTSTPLPRLAFIMQAWSKGRILPHSQEYFEVACKIRNAKPFNAFAFRVHTHSLGQVVSGYRVRKTNGTEKWDLIGKMDPKLPQMFYPLENEIVLENGDYLAARCTFDNTRNHTVRHGPRGEDEMCMFYIMFWTVERSFRSPSRCSSKGPPFESWLTSGFKSYPDEDASTLPASAPTVSGHDIDFHF